MPPPHPDRATRWRRPAIAWGCAAVVATAGGAAAAPGPPVAPVGRRAAVPVYVDALAAGFSSPTWRGCSLQARGQVHGGERAIDLDLRPGRALEIRHRHGLPLDGLGSLALWVRPGAEAALQPRALQVELLAADGGTRAAALVDYVPEGAWQADAWQPARVPLVALGGPGQTLRALRLCHAGVGRLGHVRVDDVALLPAPAAGPRWLSTTATRLVDGTGRVWAGRGANVPDTRSCGACRSTPDRAEVERRIDALACRWGATYLRLTLEAGAGEGVRDDPDYAAALVHIVDHIGRLPHVYVELALWLDPSLDADGRPTAASEPVWRRLTALFAHSPHVLFGVADAPRGNLDGHEDAAVWAAMNRLVDVIRAEEAQQDAPPHVIVVPATGGWGRHLQAYMERPIAACGGQGVAYGVQVFDPPTSFEARFERPSTLLPVIVTAFGPTPSRMPLAACDALMRRAEALGIPYAAWTFHMRCPPSLLEDVTAGGCGLEMPLTPTPWGRLLCAHLAPAR